MGSFVTIHFPDRNDGNHCTDSDDPLKIIREIRKHFADCYKPKLEFIGEEALENIAETTVNNIVQLFNDGQCPNELCFRGDSAEDCKTGKCF